MKSYRKIVVILVAAMFIMAHPVVVQANSLDRLAQVIGSSNNQIADDIGLNSSTGIKLLDMLLGFFEKLFGVVKNEPTSTIPPPYVGRKEVLGFYAEWWDGDTASLTSLQANKGQLKSVIPFWGTIQENGDISDRGAKDHGSVVRYTHQHNVNVYYMVNNAKESPNGVPIHILLNNPAYRINAINTIEKTIKQYGMNGVNIDFEMVPPGDRNVLTQFMKELYSRLRPQGYTVSIDVFPKTNENNDVAYAYDYKQLASYADKIIIMTYDQHGTWNSAGAIAGIGWVEQNLTYALKFIPKNKLYLGIASYGYDWSSKGVQDLEFKTAIKTAKQYSAKIEWDSTSQAPYYHYKDNQGISHEVWFENSYSLKFKLDLMKKYDIAGVALWKLGHEDPEYWSLFRTQG